MNLTIKPVNVRSPITGYGIFKVIAIAALILPGLLSAQISTEKPSSIPKEIVDEWKSQDGVSGSNYSSAVQNIVKTLKQEYASKVSGTDEAAYLTAAHYRRVQRLEAYSEDIQKMVYAKHHNLGNLIVGCQEGYSFPNIDEKWKGGAGIYYLEFKDYYPSPKPLIEDATGVLRDPVVSLDGKRVAFAWSKSATGSGFGARGKGYKIFELEIEKSLSDPKTAPRQITFDPQGLQVSDYEPCYTQYGDIIFNSSRCFQLIDCFTNMVSTFYICNTDGKYLRRIGYDQVHAFYPQLKSDGKILYTRWEYNDRGLMNSMGLFDMNPDGTAQNEYYGNQTTWPVTIIHGREIPGSNGKVLAIASGHHAPYYGEPLIIDPNVARNGLKAIKFVAPVRNYTSPPSGFSAMDSGGVEFKFSHPMPLDEENFLISHTPTARGIMKLYFMNIDGKQRELIAWASDQSVSQPFSVKSRTGIRKPAIVADYTKKVGGYTMQDVYIGTGSKGITKGSVKKLRVIKLEYRVSAPDARPDDFGRTGAMGWVYVPVARHTGSWQAKRIIGEAPVFADGSAAFQVPSEIPVYFQLIDENGHMIQTMRSWSTLMPGEIFSCIGCHEDKNEIISPGALPQSGVDPQPLEPFYDISNVEFSYPKIIQPILDKKCGSCHSGSGTAKSKLDLSGNWITLTDDDHKESRRKWVTSYVNLTKVGSGGALGASGRGTYVHWVDINSPTTGLSPRYRGATKSPLIITHLPAHKSRSGYTELTKEEYDKICAWIDLCIPHGGRYNEGMINASDSSNYEKFMGYRRTHEAMERKNIEEFVAAGQWGPITHVNDNNRQLENFGVAAQSPLRFMAGERKLIIVPSSEGELRISDLRGRQLTRIKIGKTSIGTSMAIPLPASLSRGVYVARLSDRNGIKSQKISLIR